MDRTRRGEVVGPFIAVSEVVVGGLMILGLFTGLAAFLGGSMSCRSASPARPG